MHLVRVKMADSAPPSAKKTKISAPVFQESEESARLFKEDRFVD